MDSTDGRIRIVHLGPGPDAPGGMSAVLRGLLGSPLAEWHELEVIPTWRTPGLLDRIWTFLRALVTLAIWCLGPGARVVHLHTTVRGSLHRKSALLFVAKALRRPVIMHVHSGPGDIATFYERLGPLRRAIFRSAIARADAVLSVSQATADEVERRFGRRNVVVVPNVVRPPTGDRIAGAGEAEAVAYLGGFANPVKGADTFLAAIREVLGARPDATVAIAGPGDPPAGTHEKISADGRVSWLGWLEPAGSAQLLANSSVFVLPSLSEGLPVALLEAMAFGCAIVATTVGGVPDTLSHYKDALLVPAGDSRALADALCALLADRELRTRLGTAARARADELSRDEVYGRLDGLYTELARR